MEGVFGCSRRLARSGRTPHPRAGLYHNQSKLGATRHLGSVSSTQRKSAKAATGEENHTTGSSVDSSGTTKLMTRGSGRSRSKLT